MSLEKPSQPITITFLTTTPLGHTRHFIVPKLINLEGQKFSRLTVVKLLPTRTKSGRAQFRCRCECGVWVVLPGDRLRSGNTKSCGCINREVIDLQGKVFARLTVIERVGRRGPEVTWLCRCECGEEAVARGRDLREGKTKSCGCLPRDVARKMGKARRVHGLANQSGNAHYARWSGIKQRCLQPTHPAFKSYGGRGIKMHEPWQDDFLAFKVWLDENLGPCPEGFSIDRIDNDGNYEPGNLRWADGKTQRSNQERKK